MLRSSMCVSSGVEGWPTRSGRRQFLLEKLVNPPLLLGPSVSVRDEIICALAMCCLSTRCASFSLDSPPTELPWLLEDIPSIGSTTSASLLSWSSYSLSLTPSRSSLVPIPLRIVTLGSALGAVGAILDAGESVAERGVWCSSLICEVYMLYVEGDDGDGEYHLDCGCDSWLLSCCVSVGDEVDA